MSHEYGCDCCHGCSGTGERGQCHPLRPVATCFICRGTGCAKRPKGHATSWNGVARRITEEP